MEAPSKGESVLVPYADWLLTRLVLAAPARLTAELLGGADSVSWQLQSFDPPADCTVDTLKAAFFRPVLARDRPRLYVWLRVPAVFGVSICARAYLSHSVALYLGNDSLTGFWFRAHCGGGITHHDPVA